MSLPPIEAILSSSRHATKLVFTNQTHLSNISKIIGGDVSSLAIEGVPGAGKTTLFAKAVADSIGDALCGGVRSKNLVIYIAPTNALVLEFVAKLYSFLFKNCSEEDFIKRTRLYGSKIYSKRYPTVLKPINDDVVLVASTEWQRVSARITGGSRKAALLIDEASRMTVSRLLIPIADGLARGRRERLGALEITGVVVIGDENQAIGLTDSERRYLLLRRMRDLTSKDKDHYIKYYFLNESYRLPPGTETPINEGYYGRRIRALGIRPSLKLDVKDIQDIVNEINSKIKISNVTYKVLYDMLYNIFIDHQYLIHVETYEFKGGDTYCIDRTELAAGVVLGLRYALEKAGNKMNISVVSPYAKMSGSPLIYLKLSGLRHSIEYGTVTSYIGRESEIVVAVMGKERPMGTFYFRDPYLYSVQLSRHSKILVTIGCAECLRKAAEYELSRKLERSRGEEWKTAVEKMMKTAETLYSLTKISLVK